MFTQTSSLMLKSDFCENTLPIAAQYPAVCLCCNFVLKNQNSILSFLCVFNTEIKPIMEPI